MCPRVVWLIDVDGTLAEPNQERLRLLPAGVNHNCLRHLPLESILEFMRPDRVLLDGATPWAESLLQHTSRFARFFLTGRHERLRDVTCQWLKEHGWDRANGFMRRNSETRVASVDLKLRILETVAESVGRVCVADDDLDFVTEANKHHKVEARHAKDWVKLFG